MNDKIRINDLKTLVNSGGKSSYSKREVLDILDKAQRKKGEFNPIKVMRGDVWFNSALKHYFIVLNNNKGVIDSVMLSSRTRHKRKFIIAKGKSRVFPTSDITMCLTRSKVSEVRPSLTGIWNNDEQLEEVIKLLNTIKV